MAKHILMVMSNSVEGLGLGREEEYNRWYSDKHLGDVLKVDGLVAAQRFKVVETIEGDKPWKYMAIYEIEADDPTSFMGGLADARNHMEMSDALDINSLTIWMFSPITERKV